MAQHIPIEAFEQKAMRKIEKSIRETRDFSGSLRYQNLEHVVGKHYIDEYKETPDDMVFGTERAAPKSITGSGREYFEVHTKPHPQGRIATNIYLVA